jgi:formiminotetrahydrofolate cyclodeaminase
MTGGLEPHSSTIAQMRVEELIGTIGEKGLAAGAGAAGAVTLALAAACAAKAAAISLEHQPYNDTLRRSQDVLERIGRFALMGADRDAESFATFIKENTLGSVVELLREGGKIIRLIDVLSDTLEKVAPQVEPSVAGDVVAARALMEAGRQIQLTNSAEAQAQKTKLASTT